MEQLYIGVVGSGSGLSEAEATAAREVGEEIARRGAVLVCGGLGGVMEAAAAGAKAAGGTVIGILPGLTRAGANPYVDIAIPTGLEEARNVLIVRASDALIAVGGEFGTLSEIAFALKTGKPVVGLGTWVLSKAGHEVDAVTNAKRPAEAVEKAFRLASGRDK
ncbi:MAG: TIGR00725 family protein [Actinobacteria bacterium]|nr:MAG: TIGR00725 family protein [Actinomycetota bacterium]